MVNLSEMTNFLSSPSATALAHPNIAFIKYWGNQDFSIRLPANGSISMNLDSLWTRTTVRFDAGLQADELTISGDDITDAGLARVSMFLDLVRGLADTTLKAAITSENNFPASAGIASSASAFAALALASTHALGLNLTEPQLSALARKGSGSACRSIPGGFVEWKTADKDFESYAQTIAAAGYWDLVDCIVIVSGHPKKTGSTEGHQLAPTSPLQAARIADSPRRLDLCREAILKKDFDALTAVVEQDNHMMHAVMMTSTPSLLYWLPETLAVINEVLQIRKEGLPVCYTIDAGPNVHVLCPAEFAQPVFIRLSQIQGMQKIITSHPGGPAYLID